MDDINRSILHMVEWERSSFAAFYVFDEIVDSGGREGNPPMEQMITYLPIRIPTTNNELKAFSLEI